MLRYPVTSMGDRLVEFAGEARVSLEGILVRQFVDAFADAMLPVAATSARR
jgi:hypothetical protein